MIAPLHLQSVARLVVTGVLISVGIGIPLATLTGAMLRMTSRQTSSTRFSIWYATLLVISLLPVAGLRLGAHSAATGEPAHALITVPGSWTLAGFCLWSFLVAVGLLRVGIGLARLRGLRRNCIAVDSASLDPMLRETVSQLNSGRRTQLCVSDELRVPTAIGFFKPCVILPSWVLQELSPSQIRPLLLHELAHVRRWDDWTNLLQKLLQAVFFFHPAVWWLEKRISLEREIACDDVVLAHTENPVAYADCLLSIAEKSFLRRGLSLAQAAVSRVRQTSARITQILDSRRSRMMGPWNASSLLLVVPSVLAFVVLAHSGSLVGFEEKTPPAQSVSRQASSPKPAGKTMQVASVKMPPLRKVSVLASAEPKHITLANQARSTPKDNVIEAKLSRDRPPTLLQCRGGARNGNPVIAQTVFVVMQTSRDGDPRDGWTVHVWQLTVFKTETVSGETIPAKKI